MRFHDIRQVLLKRIDTPDPDNRSTPRWISVEASGFIAAGLAGKSIPQRVPNRRMSRKHHPRQRLAGVALSSEQMPWRGK